MKRLNLILILVLVVPAILFAQTGWTEHTIAGTFDAAKSVYAIDLDDDNDIDVLGAAYFADDITWWENDGNENFTKHTIAGDYDGAGSVYAIDLDDDNDVDVLGAAFFADDITWWENDGNENFTEHTIAGTFDGAVFVYAIDLDDDNDIDVLGAASYADDITWWENDGNENFTKHTIDSLFDGVCSVYAIDLDDDNDIDVLGAAFFADDITWWENDGASPPGFTEHTIDSTFDGAKSVYALDLDDDNDIDVLGAAFYADDITWWENDGNENFTKHTIAGDYDGANSVYAIDLDDDGDVDVLGAAFDADDITWWENDGNENFTEHTIAGTFDGARSVYAIDLDDDNDIDVLGAASYADDITWWERMTVDVSTISIDIADTLPEGTELSPQATVENLGIDIETFDVTCEIEPGAYASTETVTDLAPGDSTQVTFSPDFTFATGSYTVTVYSQLAGDENPANDTLAKVIDTYDPGITKDVGTVSIDLLSPVPEDTTLKPHATVSNFGVNSETFSVICTIEPGAYISTIVSNIAPGESLQVTFPDEFTFVSGTYTVTVYTQLAGDENPANDTLVKMIDTYDPGIDEYGSVIPTSFSFGLKNNPAKGKAVFSLALPEAALITLRIYDVMGRLVINLIEGRKSVGYYEIPWTKGVSSGIFFYHLDSPWQQKIGKLVLLK